MDLFKKLVLLTALLALASCNETISPELQQGGVIAPPGGEESGPVDPPDAFFRLENFSAPNTNFQLHKTGAGNASAKCEMTSNPNAPFPRETFWMNPDQDITCFLEAGELALYEKGFGLSLTSSPNACKFIAYKPFSYYNRQPGDSSGTYTLETYSDTYGADYFSTEGVAIIVTPSAFGYLGNPITYTEDEALCRFNYPGQEQCDVGTIVINETYHTWDVTNAVDKTENKSRVHICGGSVKACVAGPYTSHSSIPLPNNTEGRILVDVQPGVEGSVQVSYTGLAAKKHKGTFPYANYRRELASSINYFTFPSNEINYRNSFSPGFNPGLSKTFDPRILTKYSRNPFLFLDDAGYIHDGDGNLIIPNNSTNYYERPLAADPFMGIKEPLPFFGDHSVQPFYAFECIDDENQIKARIRVLVRDWDQEIPTKASERHSEVELISDVFNYPASLDRSLWSLQDLNYIDPDHEEPTSPWANFNSYKDWDDKIQMETNGIVFKPALGFFNKLIFPRENLK